MFKGSKDRTLTTKSLCQWTAATTLVAIGSFSFFAADRIENLKQFGDVSVDVQAFRKVASMSIALDRIDDQRLIAEGNRLEEKAAIAASEELPMPSLRFARVGVFPKKHGFSRGKTRISQVVAPNDGLSASDRAELAALEVAPDPALESRALASVYGRLRFRFIAAVDAQASDERVAANARVIDPSLDAENDYPEESIRIARANPAYEYDEVPDLDVESLGTPKAFERRTQVAETAPIPVAPEPVVTAASQTDEILSHSSSTARPEIFSYDSVPPEKETVAPKKFAKEEIKPTSMISSPGLDLVPEATPVTTHAQTALDTQKIGEKEATGPPGGTASSASTPTSLLAASLPKNTPPSPPSIQENLPKPTPSLAEDMAEYSSDLSSVYGDGYEVASPTDETDADYPEDTDYSGAQRLASTPAIGASAPHPKFTAPGKPVPGVEADANGVTIDWNQKAPLPGGIRVLKPGTQPPTGSFSSRVAMNAAKEAGGSLEKFSFDPNAVGATQSSALVLNRVSSMPSPVPEVARDQCDTEKLGVEAFNAAAEKETISVCRRPLSLEGTRGDDAYRWWEAYSSDATSWPTLIYQRADDARSGDKNRVPLLSSASIRILTALSRTNTHSGMGIVFGEVPRGLDIRLLGRSDAPMYFDGGMKPGDAASEAAPKRNFVFFNVAPGQPLLSVTRTESRVSGSIPLVVKAGIATWIRVPEPVEKTFSFTVFDASSRTEKRLANMTVDLVGQVSRVGITDRKGVAKIARVATFGQYPIYVDVMRDDQSYKNRFRALPSESEARALYFFDDKRVGGWISQLSGGVSPVSGLIVGIVPHSALSPKSMVRDAATENHLRIGTFDKRGSLVPERYLLDGNDHLLSESRVEPGRDRFIGVQIPEGVAIPSVIDSKGNLVWSQIVYAQPGVINVVGP